MSVSDKDVIGENGTDEQSGDVTEHNMDEL
jgi:hypothetical protein